MKYWVLLVSLFILGCGGGESSSKETAGEEIADALNEAQEAAEAVEEVLEEAKEDIDEALEEAEAALDD